MTDLTVLFLTPLICESEREDIERLSASAATRPQTRALSCLARLLQNHDLLNFRKIVSDS